VAEVVILTRKFLSMSWRNILNKKLTVVAYHLRLRFGRVVASASGDCVSGTSSQSLSLSVLVLNKVEGAA
jgi:hypothetical protein